jgi:hypothetical protein
MRHDTEVAVVFDFIFASHDGVSQSLFSAYQR